MQADHASQHASWGVSFDCERAVQLEGQWVGACGLCLCWV